MKVCLNVCEKCKRYYDRRKIITELTENGDTFAVARELVQSMSFDNDECHIGWCKHIETYPAMWGLAYHVEAVPITDDFQPPPDCPYLLEHTLLRDQTHENKLCE